MTAQLKLDITMTYLLLSQLLVEVVEEKETKTDVKFSRPINDEVFKKLK